jgi:hypothetical protein
MRLSPADVCASVNDGKEAIRLGQVGKISIIANGTNAYLYTIGQLAVDAR